MPTFPAAAPRTAWTTILCDSLEKVFPDTEPRPMSTDIPLVAFRGQTVSFQIAVLPPSMRWPADVAELEATVEAPEHAGAQLHAVELVPVELPAPVDPDGGYLRTSPGLFPDLLRPLPEGRFRPVSEQWRSLWVTVRIAAEAPAGSAPVHVRIRTRAEQPGESGTLIGEHRLEVSVVPVRLPQMRIPVTHWFHLDGLAHHYADEVFSEGHWESIDRFLAAYVEVGGNTVLTPVWTPPIDTAIDHHRLPTQLLGIREDAPQQYTFDFTDLHRWIGLCRSHGIRWLEIPHLFTQWGARATPAVYVETPSGVEQRFGWDVPATDPTYRTFLEQLIPVLRSELDTAWGTDVIFHISDEPTTENLEYYSAAKAVVADLLDGARVIDAISDVELYESGAVAEPVVATNHAGPFLDRNVSPMWLYYCVAQDIKVANRFISLPSPRNRVLGQQLFREQADGFLHWGFNFYNTVRSLAPLNPFQDTCAGGGFYGGDAFLVYPGQDRSPWPSIRSRVLAEAMDDYRVLQLLEDLTDRGTALAALGSERVELQDYPTSADHYRRVAAMLAQTILAADAEGESLSSDDRALLPVDPS